MSYELIVFIAIELILHFIGAIIWAMFMIIHNETPIIAIIDNDMNWFGKIVCIEILVLLFPIIAVVELFISLCGWLFYL